MSFVLGYKCVNNFEVFIDRVPVVIVGSKGCSLVESIGDDPINRNKVLCTSVTTAEDAPTESIIVAEGEVKLTSKEIIDICLNRDSVMLFVFKEECDESIKLSRMPYAISVNQLDEAGEEWVFRSHYSNSEIVFGKYKVEVH